MNNLKELLKSKDWKLDPKEDKYFLEKIYKSTLSEDALALVKFLVREMGVDKIIEFGGGLSTVMITRELAAKGTTSNYISIDDSDLYMGKTKEEIFKMTPNSKVQLVHAPIEKIHINSNEYLSYSNRNVRNAISNINYKFQLVIIDGPMGWKYGRTSPLYEVIDKINEETIILLDDARRDSEKKDMENWKNFFGEKIDIEFFDNFDKGITLVKIDEINPEVKSSFFNKNKFTVKI